MDIILPPAVTLIMPDWVYDPAKCREVWYKGQKIGFIEQGPNSQWRASSSLLNERLTPASSMQYGAWLCWAIAAAPDDFAAESADLRSRLVNPEQFPVPEISAWGEVRGGGALDTRDVRRHEDHILDAMPRSPESWARHVDFGGAAAKRAAALHAEICLLLARRRSRDADSPLAEWAEVRLAERLISEWRSACADAAAATAAELAALVAELEVGDDYSAPRRADWRRHHEDAARLSSRGWAPLATRE